MKPKQEFIELLIHKYERFVAPFTFVAGFVFDTLTFKRIDLPLDHLVIVANLILAGLAIVAINLYEAGRLRFRAVDFLIPFAPVFMQFAFGGLFSAFIIFYTKSASLGKSWIFLLTLAVLLVGNERFRKKYERFIFQLSLFFTALFSYSIFALPIFFKKMGDDIFLLGGFLSICFIFLFTLFLLRLVSSRIKLNLRALVLSIVGIYAAFNFLYFFNIIPPVPLSLQESGVYHSVERDDGGYAVSFEPAPRYLFFGETSRVYHWREGEPVYYFSSVFAPINLTVPILHRWFFYDDVQKKWVEHESMRFSITGGRDGGYRGYSFKTAVKPGKWMVEVMTDNGGVLGREVFMVVEEEMKSELKFGVK